MKDIAKNFKSWIENILPMTIGSLFLFLIVVYLIIIVGKSIWVNYQSDNDIRIQAEDIEILKEEIALLENEIEYFQTNSFREKEARAKLGYMAEGEKVISLSQDKPEDRVADSNLEDKEIITPNLQLWWSYFFE